MRDLDGEHLKKEKRKKLSYSLTKVVSVPLLRWTHLVFFFKFLSGLTETCAGSFISIPNQMQMLGTVGPPLQHTELRLESVPEMEYDALGNNPRGEVCIRGKTLFSGYYKREDLLKEVMIDGWFHTGIIFLLKLISFSFFFLFFSRRKWSCFRRKKKTLNVVVVKITHLTFTEIVVFVQVTFGSQDSSTAYAFSSITFRLPFYIWAVAI